MILLVGGEKGGVGKSLIAVSLATMRALEGYDVLVIDADRQASATLWSNIRVADQILPAVACIKKKAGEHWAHRFRTWRLGVMILPSIRVGGTR